MSFWLSFHQALLDRTGAYWLDHPSDLTCKDSTQHYSVDGPLLSCKQQTAGSSHCRETKSTNHKPDRWSL
jgi:hypothetical protein